MLVTWNQFVKLKDRPFFSAENLASFSGTRFSEATIRELVEKRELEEDDRSELVLVQRLASLFYAWDFEVEASKEVEGEMPAPVQFVRQSLEEVLGPIAILGSFARIVEGEDSDVMERIWDETPGVLLSSAELMRLGAQTNKSGVNPEAALLIEQIEASVDAFREVVANHFAGFTRIRGFVPRFVRKVHDACLATTFYEEGVYGTAAD